MERLDVQRDGFHVPPTGNVDAALCDCSHLERASVGSTVPAQQPLADDDDDDGDADELLASALLDESAGHCAVIEWRRGHACHAFARQ